MISWEDARYVAEPRVHMRPQPGKGQLRPKLNPMIRVPAQYRDRTEELLGEHRSHEQMRPGLCAEGERHLRAPFNVVRQAVGSADHEQRARLADVAPPCDLLREGLARERRASLVERDEQYAAGASVDQTLGLALVPFAKHER